MAKKILQHPKVSDIYKEVFSIWASKSVPESTECVVSQPRAGLSSILFLLRNLVLKLSVFIVLWNGLGAHKLVCPVKH